MKQWALNFKPQISDVHLVAKCSNILFYWSKKSLLQCCIAHQKIKCFVLCMELLWTPFTATFGAQTQIRSLSFLSQLTFFIFKTWPFNVGQANHQLLPPKCWGRQSSGCVACTYKHQCAPSAKPAKSALESSGTGITGDWHVMLVLEPEPQMLLGPRRTSAAKQISSLLF